MKHSLMVKTIPMKKNKATIKKIHNIMIMMKNNVEMENAAQKQGAWIVLYRQRNRLWVRSEPTTDFALLC